MKRRARNRPALGARVSILVSRERPTVSADRARLERQAVACAPSPFDVATCTYPDASLICGPIEGDPADPSGATITNPKLVVEVLSPSTEQEDRGNKWRQYPLIPSLHQYLLVSQDDARIERYRRTAEGTWEYTVASGGVVRLGDGASVDIGKLYDGLPD